MTGERDVLAVLAAEHALGTLSPAVRQKLSALFRSEPELARLAAEWRTDLAPLAATLDPIEPPAEVWRAVEAALGSAPAARAPMGSGARNGAWNDVGLWRVVSLVAICIAGALGFAHLDQHGGSEHGGASHLEAAHEQGVAVPIAAAAAPAGHFAVLADEERKGALLARTDSGLHRLVLAPLRALPVPESGHYELWLVAGEAPPLSLGQLPPLGRVIERLPGSFAPGAALQVTVEADGASPSSRPSGPVRFAGTIIQIDGTSP